MSRYPGGFDAQTIKQKPERNKYGAKRVSVDGYNFDSKAEARRYNELKLMRQTGLISNLQVHPRFPIVHNEREICVVELDFKYLARGDVVVPEWRYEDVKSPATNTPLSKLKRKLVESFYGIKVTLIGL